LAARAFFLGILWGCAFGAGTWWVVISVAALTDGGTVAELLGAVLWSLVAGAVGGVVGGTIGLTAGLALALSSQAVLRQILRARLVSGGAAAALPLAVALQSHRTFSWVSYLVTGGIAIAAVVTAVLTTPRILKKPRRKEAPAPLRPRIRLGAPVCRGQQAMGSGGAERLGVDQ
jgi:hypothetical protein